jgi:hypothetical protein
VCDAARDLLALNKIEEIGASGVDGGFAETREELQERAHRWWLRALEYSVEDALPVVTQRLGSSQYVHHDIQSSELALPICPVCA